MHQKGQIEKEGLRDGRPRVRGDTLAFHMTLLQETYLFQCRSSSNEILLIKSFKQCFFYCHFILFFIVCLSTTVNLLEFPHSPWTPCFSSPVWFLSGSRAVTCRAKSALSPLPSMNNKSVHPPFSSLTLRWVLLTLFVSSLPMNESITSWIPTLNVVVHRICHWKASSASRGATSAWYPRARRLLLTGRSIATRCGRAQLLKIKPKLRNGSALWIGGRVFHRCAPVSDCSSQHRSIVPLQRFFKFLCDFC